jgi:hypothetical protein
VANFSTPTVWTLHSELIIKTKNFTCANFQPDCLWKMETNSLLLDSTLGVIRLTLGCGYPLDDTDIQSIIQIF